RAVGDVGPEPPDGLRLGSGPSCDGDGVHASLLACSVASSFWGLAVHPCRLDLDDAPSNRRLPLPRQGGTAATGQRTRPPPRRPRRPCPGGRLTGRPPGDPDPVTPTAPRYWWRRCRVAGGVGGRRNRPRGSLGHRFVGHVLLWPT